MMMRNSIDIGILSHAIHLLSIVSIIIIIVTMFIISVIIITITMYHYHHHHGISNHQPPPPPHHHHHHHRYLLHRFVTLLSCAVLHIELSERIATLVYRAQIIIIYR